MGVSSRVQADSGAADKERSWLVGTELTLGVWNSFDAALEDTRDTFRIAMPLQDLEPFLASLQDSVRCVVVGRSARPMAPPPSVSSTQVLECVRRRFVDRVHHDSGTDPQQAIHILSALGHVQCLLDMSGPDQTPDLLAGRDAGGLLIEIAHDIRSPLAAILFLLDLLRSERCGPVTPLQQQQLRLLYGASFGIMQLACDLIDSVRGTDRLVAERASDFSIVETFTSIKDIVQPMAEEKGVDVQLVARARDARRGLPTVLHRILLNLTSNAIKFSDGGVVTLAAEDLAPGVVEFSVQDSSREIPEEVVEQLFRPFRRSELRRTRNFSSAGLGLSICHKLALAVGSELRVTTSSKTGTRFHFLMELAAAGS